MGIKDFLKKKAAEIAEEDKERKMRLERDIIMALRQVYDPEIPVNVYDLGLIYEIKVDDDHNVYVQMTLTAPNCPMADYVVDQVKTAVEDVPGVVSVKIDLVFPEGLSDLDQDEEDVLYRIVQESITNAIRHGNATHIDVRIEREDNDLRIRIADNGKGCDDIQSGFGLHHMQERIDMLKGTLSYSGKDGFVIEAVVPIRVVSEEES